MLILGTTNKIFQSLNSVQLWSKYPSNVNQMSTTISTVEAYDPTYDFGAKSYEQKIERIYLLFFDGC